MTRKVLVVVAWDGLSHFKTMALMEDDPRPGPFLRQKIKKQFSAFIGNKTHRIPVVCYFMFIDSDKQGLEWRNVNGMPTALSTDFLTKIYSGYSSENIFQT